MAKILPRFIFLALASAAGILLFVLMLHNREPRYHGHPLTYWTTKLKQGPHKEHAEAQEALRAMGKSAVPSLVHDLERHDSPLKVKLLKKYAPRFHYLYRWLPEAAYWKQAAAASALGEIGPSASNAVPALLQLSRTSWPWRFTAVAALMKVRGEPIDGMISDLDDTNMAQWGETAQIVAEFGTSARPAIPALCRALTSDKGWAAAYAIEHIHSDPETAVPALMDEIKRGSKATTMINSIRALGGFEDEARPAIPLLRQLLLDDNSIVRQSALISLKNILPPAELKTLVPTLVQWTSDSDPYQRSFAKYILNEIDPEAAKKSGIK